MYECIAWMHHHCYLSVVCSVVFLWICFQPATSLCHPRHQQQQQQQQQQQFLRKARVQSSLSMAQQPTETPSSLSSLSLSSPSGSSSTPEKLNSFVCEYCKAELPSRTKLFKHLRAQHDLEALLQQDQEQQLAVDKDVEGEDTTTCFAHWTPSQRTDASIAARSLYYNVAHDAYYRAQVDAGAFPLQDWELAQEYFRKPLPVAFRLLSRPASNIHQNNDIRFAFWDRLQQLVPSNSLASCPALDPNMAKTAVIPPRQWSAQAQQALMDAQEVGAANRQELCSMIPPLLLLQTNDVLVGRGTILDLCAAPGSKSLQLLDQLQHVQRVPKSTKGKSNASTSTSQQDDATPNSNNSNDHNDSDNSQPVPPTLHTPSSSSMLVCNDSNRQRLLTVARRSRRCPAIVKPSLILNASDGRYFPALRMYGGYKVKFDRVLADVPCSGDGTLRKLSWKEWQQWNVKSHLQLHTLQVRLLTRALECVKKGGRVVYSTCSLDPIEDEAVVVTAIARRGGPSVYRICPIPDRLCQGSTEKLSYCSGATQWIVPHPQYYGKATKEHGTVHDDEAFTSIDQVPAMLRKKDIRPSMFPPRSRTAAAMAEVFLTDEYKEEKMALARKFGEILDDHDMAQYEAMLPNCARIFPQHLDSGGFFCAVIERVPPAYYPVCYPLERQKREQESAGGLEEELNKELNRRTGDIPDNYSIRKQSSEQIYKYHGRILTNIASAQQMRDLVAKDKVQGDEVVFEGVATKELAISWLREHRAFIPGISEQLLKAPSTENTSDSDDDEELEDTHSATINNHRKPKQYVNDTTKSLMYTRFFPSPHPSLVAEFCDFFGLITCPRKAAEAGVDPFPVERLVFVGGGDGAADVTSCLDPDEAHTALSRESDANGSSKIPRNRRFLRLVLVSEELRNLFKGGAKFSPMEFGLSLCWVPVPGEYRPPLPDRTISKSEESASDYKEPTRFDDPTMRAAESGRYGLLDEAAEYLGRCATKRIVTLSTSEALTLLDKGYIEVKAMDPQVVAGDRLSGGYWGGQLLWNLATWSLGATIVIVQRNGLDKGCSGHHGLFIPCVLKEIEPGTRQLQLVAELRLTEAWKRLLGALDENY